MEVFGPIQSRRLGLSLGINHLPPKTCSYSCVYCQLGRTSFMTTNRSLFSQPTETAHCVQERLEELHHNGIKPDVITFVSNGEPTLDRGLGESLRLVGEFGIPTAVITNASMVWHPDVSQQLMEADIVSLKIDSVINESWHAIDRPHGTLRLDKVFNGIHWFAHSFKGRLITETMLINGINDTDEEANAAATFIADLNPAVAYLALPLRPPAEDWVKAPTQARLTAVYHIFQSMIPRVEILMNLPESDLSDSDHPVDNLLNTLMVHPLPRKEIEQFLNQRQLNITTLDDLVSQKKVKEVQYKGETFYIFRYESR